MPLSLIIFDDFYGDPMEIRRAALGLLYPPVSDANYPGRNSNRPIMITGLDEMISKIVNEPVVGSRKAAHCYFRVAREGDDQGRRYNVHIDPEAVWSGILYLTLPEHCRGGTEFFRHKETQSDRAAIYPDELKVAGAKNFGDAGDPIIQRDSTDPSKWEHLMTVPMRFNRLILLRPWLWHTAGMSFGTSNEDCRLIQLLFFAPGRR